MSIQLREFPVHHRLRWGTSIIETAVVEAQGVGFTSPPCAIELFNFIFFGRVWAPGKVPGAKVTLSPIPLDFVPPLMDTRRELAMDDADLWLAHTSSSSNAPCGIRLGYEIGAILAGDLLDCDSEISLDQKILVLRQELITH